MPLVGFLEHPDDGRLSLEESGEGVFCEVFAGRGEVHEHTPPVPGVGLSFDEPGRLESIEPDCHSPAGEEEIFSQLGWGQGADEVDLGEGFEITSMAEAIGGGDAVESRLDHVGGAQQAGTHFEWGEVGVGARCLPSLEDVVESVGRALSGVHGDFQYS